MGKASDGCHGEDGPLFDLYGGTAKPLGSWRSLPECDGSAVLMMEHEFIISSSRARLYLSRQALLSLPITRLL